VGSFSSLFFYF